MVVYIWLHFFSKKFIYPSISPSLNGSFYLPTLFIYHYPLDFIFLSPHDLLMLLSFYPHMSISVYSVCKPIFLYSLDYIFLSTNFFIFLLSHEYDSIYLAISPWFIYLSIQEDSNHIFYLSSNYLFIYLTMILSIYLSYHDSIYLSINLSRVRRR